MVSIMPPLAEFRYDAAVAIRRGRRDHQEDAVAADFADGASVGFAVVADGMGGHAAGEVASGIVVTEVFAALKARAGNRDTMEPDLTAILHDAAARANAGLRAHAEASPDTAGMGATLVAPVLMGNRLYWISVGDSPLYLYRQGTLLRLNQDHSLVPQIDYLVRKGLLEEDEGLCHPDRNCLTSVLSGAAIARIDCPDEPVRLFDGDLVIAASDGVQFLDDDAIAGVLRAVGNEPARRIGALLMGAIEALADPEQDNAALCVIRVCADRQAGSDLAMTAANNADSAPAPRRKRQTITFLARVGRAQADLNRATSRDKIA